MDAATISNRVTICGKTFLGLLLIPAMALVSFTLAPENLPIGAALPKADVKLKDVTGQDITLQSAMKENGLLVMFSCNTCPVVVKNQSRAKEICAYLLNKNVGVVLLNSNEANRSDDESLEAMRDYAKSQGYNW